MLRGVPPYVLLGVTCSVTVHSYPLILRRRDHILRRVASIYSLINQVIKMLLCVLPGVPNPLSRYNM